MDWKVRIGAHAAFVLLSTDPDGEVHPYLRQSRQSIRQSRRSNRIFKTVETVNKTVKALDVNRGARGLCPPLD